KDDVARLKNLYSADVVGYANVPKPDRGEQEKEVIHLHFAAPSNILPALQEVAKNSSAGKEAAPAGRFAIVLPSNAPAAPPAISVTDSGDLALQGDSATIERMRQLVARLDQPTRQELIAPGTFVPSDRGLGWR